MGGEGPLTPAHSHRSTWAVVPVKRFEAAKSRLAGAVAPEERRNLARAMFEHVARVLSSTPRVGGLLVVTDSAEAARMSTELGAAVLLDRTAGPLACHVDDALVELARRRVERALVLMSDLPELGQKDVEALLFALNESGCVVARDSSGRHTNALGLRLADRFATHFGRPESFRLHVEAARRCGLSVRQLTTPGLAFDVDTPDDYALLVGRRLRAG